MREHIKLNLPMVDYIRATTYRFKNYQGAVFDIVPPEMSGERDSWRQYRGDSYGQIFHGQAEIRGRTNYLVQVSGHLADEKWLDVYANKMNPSRIDFQVTAHVGEWWDAREFHDAVKFGVWEGRRRDPMIIQSVTGSTVSIGSRSSDRFIRVYEKDENVLRFEVEYKWDRAKVALSKVAEGGRDAIAAILTAELLALPETVVTERFYAVLGEADPMQLVVGRISTTKEKRLAWIASLLPTIEKMMADDDYGRRVTRWFDEMVYRRYENEQ